jgi:hypothetical protein
MTSGPNTFDIKNHKALCKAMSKIEKLTFYLKISEKQVDKTKEKRIYATLNAAVFMLNQIDRRYKELVNMLHEYNQDKEKRDGISKADQFSVDIGYRHGNYMVSLGWDIVDWCDRLRKMLGVIAGIKRKEEWYLQFKVELKIVEDIRNFLQHYDKETNNFVLESYPLMGAIYAYFPAQNGWYARLIPSTPLASIYHERFEVSGIDLPLRGEDDIDFVTFSVAEKAVNLTRLIQCIDI